MKKIILMISCLGIAAPLFADGTNQLADENARVSYALGMMNGTQWRLQELGFDPDVYMRGIKDGLAGGKTELTEAEAQQVLQKFKGEFRDRQVVKLKAQGETFLTTNKLTPGVQLLSVTLPNGTTSELQYLVVSNGTGPVPAATDRVSVNYRGTLLNGTEFDSSYKRGQPATFPVGGVIKGWTAALEKMAVGSKWKLFIPSDLAYGERGQPNIPPYSVLIFDVELLAIEPPAPAAPAPAASTPTAPLTSDIIKVPSAEEIKNGAKVEVIKAEDVQKAQAQAQAQQTNK
jgi:FKBP-type peptidyl-prolyl cis-trans isomerase